MTRNCKIEMNEGNGGVMLKSLLRIKRSEDTLNKIKAYSNLLIEFYDILDHLDVRNASEIAHKFLETLRLANDIDTPNESITKLQDNIIHIMLKKCADELKSVSSFRELFNGVGYLRKLLFLKHPEEASNLLIDIFLQVKKNKLEGILENEYDDFCVLIENFNVEIVKVMTECNVLFKAKNFNEKLNEFIFYNIDSLCFILETISVEKLASWNALIEQTMTFGEAGSKYNFDVRSSVFTLLAHRVRGLVQKHWQQCIESSNKNIAEDKNTLNQADFLNNIFVGINELSHCYNKIVVKSLEKDLFDDIKLTSAADLGKTLQKINDAFSLI